jgi:hypothetical protein
MYRRYNTNLFQQPIYAENEDRFIWPLIPFLGGAAIGYIAGRPQYSYTYPSYYPVYYPYYPNYYRPYSMSNYTSNTYQAN